MTCRPRRSAGRLAFRLTLLAVLAAGCAVSPTGRKQLTLIPETELDAMGAKTYEALRREAIVSTDPDVTAYVQCVADALVQLPDVQGVRSEWEVTVFEDDMVNAFALPGGKIGIYTGLLRVAETPSQLAAVMGHEVGHVLARHGNERVSQQMAVGEALGLAEAWLGGSASAARRETVMGLLGAGAQVGVLLPFSRAHESEADAIGQTLMARAGFDPRESVRLWQNMAGAGNGGPPEFLSTHPAHETRIRDLQAGMEASMVLFREAGAAGREPACVPPSS